MFISSMILCLIHEFGFNLSDISCYAMLGIEGSHRTSSKSNDSDY